MKENYTPGEGCECHAHSESECGCDVDWTPREVHELRETISDMEIRHAATMLHTQSIVDEANELREQRDRLLEEREQWRLSSVCRELREQRDRLEEALELLVTTDHESKEAFIERVKQALAAVKG
jgi:hypothetical protein